jgi:hypothetical protein
VRGSELDYLDSEIRLEDRDLESIRVDHYQADSRPQTRPLQPERVRALRSRARSRREAEPDRHSAGGRVPPEKGARSLASGDRREPARGSQDPSERSLAHGPAVAPLAGLPRRGRVLASPPRARRHRAAIALRAARGAASRPLKRSRPDARGAAQARRNPRSLP